MWLLLLLTVLLLLWFCKMLYISGILAVNVVLRVIPRLTAICNAFTTGNTSNSCPSEARGANALSNASITSLLAEVFC